MRYEGGQFYLKSEEEMAELFKYAPEAVENTHKIAERCNVEIEFELQSCQRLMCQKNMERIHEFILMLYAMRVKGEISGQDRRCMH